MENIITLLTAFGLGSVITALIQTWLSNRSAIKNRNFQEKKEAYVGLLEAYHKASVENTDEAAKGFAYWQMRCELVAPESVRLAINHIVQTNDDQRARYDAHESLKAALRADLKVSGS